MSTITAVEAALYLAGGGALGALYCALLRSALTLHARRAAVMRVLPLHAGRLVMTVAAFWLAAQQGAWPLLTTLLGFVIARTFVQRRVGSV
jgi:hypothetical protein